MAKPVTKRESLTRGQLGRRWGVSVNRVRQLIESGELCGTFSIPSCGRFGKVVKIPLASVLEAERRWQIAGTTGTENLTVETPDPR